MKPNILKTLSEVLDSQGLTPLLGGSWAVGHHGYARFTQDIDFIFSSDDKAKVVSAMTDVECQSTFDLPVATRFVHWDRSVPAIDALWIEPRSYQRLLTNAVTDPSDSRLKIIAVGDLIAMKLHSLRAREERGERDEVDIKHLIKANEDKVAFPDYLAMVEKYDPEELCQRIQNYHPAAP